MGVGWKRSREKDDLTRKVAFMGSESGMDPATARSHYVKLLHFAELPDT